MALRPRTNLGDLLSRQPGTASLGTHLQAVGRPSKQGGDGVLSAKGSSSTPTHMEIIHVPKAGLKRSATGFAYKDDSNGPPPVSQSRPQLKPEDRPSKLVSPTRQPTRVESPSLRSAQKRSSPQGLPQSVEVKRSRKASTTSSLAKPAIDVEYECEDALPVLPAGNKYAALRTQTPTQCHRNRRASPTPSTSSSSAQLKDVAQDRQKPTPKPVRSARPSLNLQEISLAQLQARYIAHSGELMEIQKAMLEAFQSGDDNIDMDYLRLKQSYLDERTKEAQAELRRRETLPSHELPTACAQDMRDSTANRHDQLSNRIDATTSSSSVIRDTHTSSRTTEISPPKMQKLVSNKANDLVESKTTPPMEYYDESDTAEQPTAGPSNAHYTMPSDWDDICEDDFNNDEDFYDFDDPPPPMNSPPAQRTTTAPIVAIDDESQDIVFLSGNIDSADPEISEITNFEYSRSTTTSTNEAESSRRKPNIVDDYGKKDFPWSRDAAKALVGVFKLQGWRQNQLQAINTTLDGKHCFVLMPTGGGKSLCYQLPAVVNSGKTHGVTIVISPLISLITDQVQSLCDKGIGAAAYMGSGSMTQKERDVVTQDLRCADPALCLVYITPEMIMQSDFFCNLLTQLMRRDLLARFVIDEAHCVSQWGHDFRPDYVKIGPRLQRDFKGIPILALTATANDRVKQDVMSNLGIQGCTMLTQSFNRPNLSYDVQPKTKNLLQDIAHMVTVEHKGQCGIIYCLSKKQCEDIAANLNKDFGVSAHHYHAGMSKTDRQKVQRAWQTGKYQLICATIAFGMGIDKADVRFVIHFTLPSSLEGYYQETGRAGRDGKKSRCVLFFGYKDSHTIQRMHDRSDVSRDQKDRLRTNLRQVIQFCLNRTDCRRSQVLQYFGEKFEKGNCAQTCDNCRASQDFVLRDVTKYAKSCVNLVQALHYDKRITMLHCADVFRGCKTKKIVDSHQDQLPGAGAGSDLERGDVERLFQLLVAEEVLSERIDTNAMGFSNAYIQLGRTFKDIVTGKKLIKMAFETTKSKVNPVAKVPKKVSVSNRKGKMSKNRRGDDEDDDDESDIESKQDENGFPPRRGAVSRTAAGNAPIDRTDPDACYKELVRLRRQIAIDDDCDTQALFRDEVLQLMVLTQPTDLDQLLAMDGVDKESVEQYGSSFLEVCQKYNLQTQSNPPKTTASRASKQPSKASTKTASTSTSSKATKKE